MASKQRTSQECTHAGIYIPGYSYTIVYGKDACSWIHRFVHEKLTVCIVSLTLNTSPKILQHAMGKLSFSPEPMQQDSGRVTASVERKNPTDNGLHNFSFNV
eukprot:1708311-Pleurochrysis_carterae.AAC.2